ncbi:MAG TPA: hypothetical protein VMR37_02605 [Rhabdochlamydiaceae bacterium]|nr:hypothetical protein [Rhabdochlamydiaceae bacterium]
MTTINMPTLNNSCASLESRSPALAKKDSAFWVCVEREVDGPGFIYKLTLREQYDAETAKTDLLNWVTNRYKVERLASLKRDEIYPAVEPTSHRNIFVKLENYVTRLGDLGYNNKADNTGQHIYLPDTEAIKARFEKLRKELEKTHPHLEPLNITSSEGVAGDMEFIEAYLKGSVGHVSKGEEYVHDNVYHLIPTIDFIVSDPEYYRHRLGMEKVVRTVYNQILLVKKVIEQRLIPQKEIDLFQAQLPKITATLATLVDVFWTASNKSMLDDFLFAFNKLPPGTIWEDEDYAKYGQRKFGEKVNIESLNQAWKLMTELEKKYQTLSPAQEA